MTTVFARLNSQGSNLNEAATRLLSGDPIRELVTHTLFRAATIAAFLFVVDFVATHWATPLSVLRLSSLAGADGDLGPKTITFFLAYLGVLPTVVVALTSLAVATVGAYGSPSLLMLTPSYSRRWWDLALYPVVGSTSRFQRALILSLGLTASLLVLAGGREVGLVRNELPTLILTVLLLVGTLSSVLVFVVWLVDLRRPSQVAFATWQLADNILSRVQDLGRSQGKLTPNVWRGVATPFPSAYREQEHLKRCVYALTELALRTMADRQRFTARESVEALARISQRYRSRRPFPKEWDDLRGWDSQRFVQLPPTPEDGWFDRVLVESFESVVLAAAELHYFSVARDSGNQLMILALHLAVQHTPGDSPALAQAVTAFANVLDECAQFGEATVLEALLTPAARAFGIVAKSATRNPATMKRLQWSLVASTVRAVTNDDVVILRATLTVLSKLCVYARARPHVVAAALDLGGTALASRRYQAASILIDWFLLGRADGTEPIATAASDRGTGASISTDATPSYVRPDYVQLFVLLAASRITQISLASLPSADHAAIDRFVATIDDADRRARFVCERMARAVSYPVEEINGWLTAVAEFTSPHAHRAEPHS